MKPLIKPKAIKKTATKPVSAISNLHQVVKDELAEVDQVISTSLQHDLGLITEMGSRLVMAGGKRLRPLLTLITAQVFGYTGKQHIRLAACIEMIHTATLFHDDVIDHSAHRRGQPTANTLWSNTAAVLVGDYLLANSFRLLLQLGQELGSNEIVDRLLTVSCNMAAAELQQLQHNNKADISLREYLSIIDAKTGDLFAAATRLAALIAGAEKRMQQQMAEFGTMFGRSFQVVDDILDYSDDRNSKTGKPTRQDLKDGKMTLPAILAYQDGSAAEQQFWHSLMAQPEPDDLGLDSALVLIERHNGVNRAFEFANSYAAEALEYLQAIPVHPLRDLLAAFIHEQVDRSF